VLTIEDRIAQNVDDDAIYLVVDNSAHRIAGNLTSWPAGVTIAGAWYELPVQRSGVRSLARVQRFDLLGGYHLLIGRDVRARAQLRALIANAMFWALLVLMALGVVGAVLVRGLFQRAIANISATAAAIAAGDLTRRVRLSGRGDEFDQLAETINVMLDRIGRLMDGVRQVSNAIAHDLRTPITRARTRLEDAALHATTEAELHAAIERATVDLDGIVAVFQALLRIAEIEAGSRRSAFAPIDLAPVLSDIGELYEAVAEERGLRLKLRAGDMLPAFGDREMIQQAVANLLDNALKFSPPGGTVTLGGDLKDGAVRITVADDGPGMPPSDLARATERFFRADTARNTPGSGLGLALVAAVAGLHGGMLTLVNGEPGLIATLILPATSAVAPPTALQVAAD
jgi:signal transduction histidine kinase